MKNLKIYQNNLIKILELDIKNKLFLGKVSDVTYHNIFAEKNPIGDYNNYSYKKLYAFYKLQRLVELKIISNDENKRLKEIYEKYEKISYIIGGINFDNFMNNKESIKYPKKYKYYEQELNKYRLLDFNIDIQDIMDNIIRKEFNQEKPKSLKKSK